MKSILKSEIVIAKDSTTERSKSCACLPKWNAGMSNLQKFNTELGFGDCFVDYLNKPYLKLILIAMTDYKLKSYQL